MPVHGSTPRPGHPASVLLSVLEGFVQERDLALEEVGD